MSTAPVWTLVAVTDSVALAAARNQPHDGPHISYLEEVSRLLAEAGDPFSLQMWAKTGRTAPDAAAFLSGIPAPAGEAWLLLQVGGVDCIPRVIPKSLRTVIGWIRPRWARREFLRLATSSPRRWMHRLAGNMPLVGPADFKTGLATAIEAAQGAGYRRILIANIHCSNQQTMHRLVWLEENVHRYNRLIDEVAARAGACVINVHDMLRPRRDEWLYDGMHLTWEGKQVLARAVAERLLSLRREPG